MTGAPPPRYFDCAAPDQAMYAVDRYMPSTIHVRVDLERPLDAERLARAWKRLPERHPILGCTLRSPRSFPRWRPGRADPRPMLEETEAAAEHPHGPGPAELALLNEGLDVRRSPPARLALLNRIDGSQRLLLTIHHSAMDARACVNVAKAVNELYASLAADPELALAPDYGARTMYEVFKQQGISARQRRRFLKDQRRREARVGKSRHREPRPRRGIAYRPATVTYREWLLPPDLLAAFESSRRAAGWTLNDVLLGGIAWSWAQAMGAGEHRRNMSVWLATADTRPWFGVQGGLGNLSSLEPVGLPAVEQATPAEAVAIAHAAMAERKVGRLGLGAHILGKWLRRLSLPGMFNLNFRNAVRLAARLALYTRTFTNIGALGDELCDWDGVAASHATVIAPLPLAPITIITGSGFRGRVSLVVGYGEGWFTEEQLTTWHRALLDGLDQLATPH